MKILFVCTGNSCRSPMAEYIARDIFNGRGLSCEFASAGISVLMALPASENAVKICEARGFNLSEFKTRQVTAEHIQWADLILTMTQRHKAYLKLQLSKENDKVYTLGEYLGDNQLEIPDPFGGDFQVYNHCAVKLEETIKLLADKLTNKLGKEPEQTGEKKAVIAIGSDHAGYELKTEIINFLRQEKIEYKDYGAYNTDSVDYPIYAQKISEAVVSGECAKGILICGTGIGVSMAANRIKGVRCAVCHDVFSAKATRQHNDANILAMGGRVIGYGHALEVVKAFLDTEFSGCGSHVRRLGMF